ncbi:MAG: DUF4861 domain-containing protein [Paludibacter sp.]|nr:DUF4861 domain-containing protein [Bacteroidales bacterium]MCM1068399.1 DUF4861 domain-containing protein [Prevotella sp.]MCM1354745.1 DUF4861 domain-containing protein [Bacteroides sp.]MCM1442154.1 DUF4861 domain-containing protein [Muribaculum sp.]MCM1482409.1 DUF4861 domain-containing protein [Paludibacter sp.]
MKKLVYLVLLSLVFTACHSTEKRIRVFNPSLEERTNELVETDAQLLGITADRIGKYALYDENAKQVPFQLVCDSLGNPVQLLFQVSIRGGMQTFYTWRKGKPLHITPKVFARYVPERKDDFAFENEYAAFRMYGPALADENPSNGVDLWLKCTDELIVDSFYYREHELGYSYHINWGKGLDCYKVGHTLGCGGIAPYVNGALLVGDHYEEWQTIEEGELRTAFRLIYGNMTQAITLEAGSPFCKCEVVCTEDADSLQMAAGIFLHDVLDNVSYSVQGGWAAYAENAVSDAGVPQGRNYAGVILPGTTDIFIQDKTLLALTDYHIGDTLTYWFAGGWSQWQFPTDADWFSAVAQKAHLMQYPLEVTVL